MNTTLSIIALALAGTLAVHAQDTAPEGGKGERRGGNRPVPPAVLKEFDKDGDGKLSDEETKALREARQAKILEKYDADKDGKLSDEEKKAMRADLEAKRKALVEKYDADKDGKLSREEFKAARDAGEDLSDLRPMGGGRREGGPGGRGGQGGGEKPTPPAGE